jgi:hypothetical protein
MNAPFILPPSLDWRTTFLHLRPKIEKALKVGDDTYNFIDLAVAIENGRFKTFYRHDAILLVEINKFPRFQTANFFLAAGRLQSVLDLEARAVIWAKEQGCKYACMHGRRGWKRTLKTRNWKTQDDKLILIQEL